MEPKVILDCKIKCWFCHDVTLKGSVYFDRRNEILNIRHQKTFRRHAQMYISAFQCLLQGFNIRRYADVRGQKLKIEILLHELKGVFYKESWTKSARRCRNELKVRRFEMCSLKKVVSRDSYLKFRSIIFRMQSRGIIMKFYVVYRHTISLNGSKFMLSYEGESFLSIRIFKFDLSIERNESHPIKNFASVDDHSHIKKYFLYIHTESDKVTSLHLAIAAIKFRGVARTVKLL